MTEAEERDSVQDQLCARIEELEKEKLELNEQLDIVQRECDALSAHLERLQRAFKATMVSGWSVPAEEALVEVFSDSPQTSLARLKAQWQTEEALEEALKQVAYCNEVGFLPESVRQSVSDALAAAPKPETQP